MIRSHGTVVIYGDELELPPDLIKKIETFSQWLSCELDVLEARWRPHAAPLARAASKQESSKL
jgi:hypothetical protein